MTLTLEPHPADPKLWAWYVDALGQKVRADDYVAYSSVAGKSPKLVIARVIEIRRVDSTGNAISSGWRGSGTPSCKVKVRPLINARNFVRLKNAKAVTLAQPGNVIKIRWKPNYKTESILSRFVEE